MKGKQVNKPRDVKQYWKAACCGLLSLDADEPCGFCEDSARICAEKCSEAANAGLIVTGNGDVGDREDVCGGSGFWCKGCDRFWAQDTCGNMDGEFYAAADDLRLWVNGDRVECVCGHKLMKYVPEIDE